MTAEVAAGRASKRHIRLTAFHVFAWLSDQAYLRGWGYLEGIFYRAACWRFRKDRIIEELSRL